MNMLSSLFFSKAEKVTPLQWFVILIGFSVPISTAFDNLMLALVLLGTLFSVGKISQIVREHPVARAAILLFSMLLIAMFYGLAPWKEALVLLMKYIDLMFIPIFIFVLSNETVQRKARRAFLAAMAFTLSVSYLVGFRLIAVANWMQRDIVPDNPAIFHSHITQNNMMAFAVFLALLEARATITRTGKIGWSVFALLASFNILFMVQGRTGYIILVILFAWFAWTTLARYLKKRNKKVGWQVTAIVLAGMLFSALLVYNTSTQLRSRVDMAVAEFKASSPENANATSIGERKTFVKNTLEVVREHPVFGVGTGGFAAAYAQQVEGKGLLKTVNPHNEYLMISAQTGIIGLLLMLYLFYSHGYYAKFLSNPFEQDAARGLLLAYIVNCSVNSALMDHADGLFFSFMTAVFFANFIKNKHQPS